MVINGSVVEPVRIAHWHAPCHIRFSDTNVMMCESYVDVLCEVPPVEAGSGIAGVVKNDDD